jgi:exopolysaccharide biosynthesis polyprenyl glycosylphosphotransferase
MGTIPSIGPKRDVGSSNLRLVESVAKHQIRLQRYEHTINVLLVGLKYLLFLVAFFLLYQWHVDMNFKVTNAEMWLQRSQRFESYLFLLGIILTIYTISIAKKGLFTFESHSSLTDDFFKITHTIFLSFVVAVGLLFLMKTSITYSRLFIVSYAMIMLLTAFGIRAVKTLLISKLRKSNRLVKNVLIVGAGKVGQNIGEFLVQQKSSGYQVIGYLDDHKKDKSILGTIDELESTIQRYNIHEMYITIPSERKVIQKVLGRIKKYDIGIKIIPEMYDFASSAIHFRSSDLYPYVEVVKTPLRGFNLFLKRMMDVTLTSIGILFLLPFFCLVGLLIKIDSRGPVFFKQERIGKNGVPFNMYKFRSMVINAEELKKKLQQKNELDGPVFKIKNDPRITRLGRFIRKYSIDELPQLFNVLRGEMSLIGPRPPLTDEVEQYTDYHWRRLDVRPGISGLWQVSGRNNISFEEWVSLDVYYIENWSIKLDTKILLQTIPVVIFGKGAY